MHQDLQRYVTFLQILKLLNCLLARDFRTTTSALHVKRLTKSRPDSLGRENSFETGFLQTLKMQLLIPRLNFFQISRKGIHL